MSAVKIILKRSSILGKRPSNQLIEPGELALNNNSTEPGIYFETNDGNIVKAGPTAYLPGQPTSQPARGELWVDSDTKTLNIGTADFSWQKVAAPWLGGTNGYGVFVAPDYAEATDSLNNDGQTVPFLTINRAIIEVGKQMVRQALQNVATNDRFVIFLAPGSHAIANGPGVLPASFNIDFSPGINQDQPTQAALQQFNHVAGGLILPRGVSLVGMDLKKTELRPSYVPKYTHPDFPPEYRTEPNGPIISNEPLSSIFRWSGNTYVTNFSVEDKKSQRFITKVAPYQNSTIALFETSISHGLEFNDFVQVDQTTNVSSTNATNITGQYYVQPINAFSFLLSRTSLLSQNPQIVNLSNLPPGIETQPVINLYDVQDIYPYFSPLRDPNTGIPLESYEFSNYSANRLSVFGNASEKDLNDFYIKIQRAYPDLFGESVNLNVASEPETVIVAPTTGNYPNNLSSNSTNNSSPYVNQVNHRSNYGFGNTDANGDLVTGFKSVIINSSTAVLLQLDPAGYQIYSSQEGAQSWVGLTSFVAQQLGVDVTRVRISPQLTQLNLTSILNIRYYYETLKVLNPVTGELQSTGITDIDRDFRHFGFRVRGSNAYMQAQSTYTIGAAVGCWALNGATMSLTNATSNFGSVAFMSEGFAGIGTLAGANDINKGFLQSGFIRPVALSSVQVLSDGQKRILGLGSRIIGATLDPTNPAIQLIYLEASLDPASLLPFSLRPGSALFVDNDNCTYRGFFATDGSQTAILTSLVNPTGGAVLRLRASDSTIPNQTFTTLALPYIRRFLDPRQPTEKSYGFYIQSTNPNAQAPQLGSVLRLNQSGQQLAQSLKRNYQFDPGQYGGVAQVFSVDSVQSIAYANSVNYNNKISDKTQGPAYAAYISLSDSGVPWLQNINLPPFGITGFNNPNGSYVTFQNKNYYAAENNEWQALYYGTSYTPENGPIKTSPDQDASPFVPSNVLLRQETVTTSWQGDVSDSFYSFYAPTDTYLRGVTLPYGEIYGNYQVDNDDSSNSLGIIYTKQPTTSTTVTVSPMVTVQTGEQPTLWTTPPPANPTFGRPQIDSVDFLTVQDIINPKQEVSVLRFSNSVTGRVEYVRVISLNTNTALVIRNYYPIYAINIINPNGTLYSWPQGTQVTVCTESNFAEPFEYDPDWSITKSTLFRYYQVMGYSPDIMREYLTPALPGQRVFLNTSIPLQPSAPGYAQQTAAWPVEFNQPSTIIAGTHSWQYCGYLDYSRGLPKYQSNEIPRKLQYDFLATSVWGGRLTVTGLVDNGNLVFLGPVREALTGNYYLNNTPVLNFANRQTYTSPVPVQFPTQITVFSADSISAQFNGVLTTFSLQRGGFDIPPSQLLTQSVIVNIGAVTQIPGVSYTITDSEITFTEPPANGASADIRVITSSDNEETLVAVPLSLNESFDGTRVAFTSTIPSEYQNLIIDEENVFIFFSGTEQIPGGVFSYVLTRPSTSTLNIAFTEAPAATVSADIRAFCSGYTYVVQGQFPVQMYSFDDISLDFDSATTIFTLRYNGDIVNPAIVNSQNVFVSLGGAMQIPNTAYTIANSQIIFTQPPATTATCNIRLITKSEFIPCTVNGVVTQQTFGLPIV
jgi:hypothetical protein